ncbi:hypothetical protein EYF80_015053 [Liparis tanakae]|uniref:Uncharacterized protein n=1 Tax=Liparis tanakae TaxID=230148 RepID=A0A4Z2IBB1_9TELE|nr:hypothetical protein EYF80_015053 [Liparis tanakae]
MRRLQGSVAFRDQTQSGAPTAGAPPGGNALRAAIQNTGPELELLRDGKPLVVQAPLLHIFMNIFVVLDCWSVKCF